MDFETRLGYQIGLIGFLRPQVILRLSHTLPLISMSRVFRLAGITLGAFLAAPLSAWEWVRHERAIRATKIEEPPIFIIGHWRSGTTHLHNLMSMDPRLGSLRMFQTLSPDCSLATRGWLPQLLGRIMPLRRPMDQMEWPMEAPQEEEIALAKMTPYSWYLSFLFPKQAVSTFDRFVLLRNARASIRREVERTLMRVYRIATRHEGGRRLLLKNPVNTCRIPLLLGLFPNAKFVFIHRSPHEVFDSTLNLHRKILDLTSLQEVTEEDIERNVIELHQRVTETYLRDRQQIPAGHLVEIAYNDLVEKPETVLRHVYTSLGLGGFETARTAIAAHLESQRSYRRNQFQASARKRRLIESEWDQDFREWGYPRETT